MRKLLSFVTALLLILIAPEQYGCNDNVRRPTALQNVADSVPSFTICKQEWTVKNLDVTTYRNGDTIPQVTNDTAWSNLTTGAWCWYNNDSATYSGLGRLYNWYAVHDPRGLAPKGWHVPSDSECMKLSACLGGEKDAYDALKASDGSHRIGQNGGILNSSGFTGLLAGEREADGEFRDYGALGIWWNSTADGGGYGGWSYCLNLADGTFTIYNWYKLDGFLFAVLGNDDPRRDDQLLGRFDRKDSFYRKIICRRPKRLEFL